MIEPKQILTGVVDNFVQSFLPSPKVLAIIAGIIIALIVLFLWLRVKFGQIIQTRGKLDGL